MSAGHNSAQLRSVVERIERLEEEKKTLSTDISEVYKEAKGNGFDQKILRKVVAARRRDPKEREAEAEMMAIYLDSIEVLK